MTDEWKESKLLAIKRTANEKVVFFNFENKDEVSCYNNEVCPRLEQGHIYRYQTRINGTYLNFKVAKWQGKTLVAYEVKDAGPDSVATEPFPGKQEATKPQPKPEYKDTRDERISRHGALNTAVAILAIEDGNNEGSSQQIFKKAQGLALEIIKWVNEM